MCTLHADDSAGVLVFDLDDRDIALTNFEGQGVIVIVDSKLLVELFRV